LTAPDPPLGSAPFREYPTDPKGDRPSPEPVPARMPDLTGSATAVPDAGVQPPQEAPVLAALRCCLEKRPAEAVHILAVYDKRNQDVLLCLLPLAARLAEGSLSQASPQEVSAILTQLNSVMIPLRPMSALTISKMCYCRAIEKFGSYEPFPEQ